MKRNIVLLLSFFLSTAAASSQSFKVESPDGSQVAEISASIVDGKMSITYQTSYCGRPVVLESALDVTFDNHVWENALGKKADKTAKWFDNLVLDSTETFSRDKLWHNPYGERSLSRMPITDFCCISLRRTHQNTGWTSRSGHMTKVLHFVTSSLCIQMQFTIGL